MNPPFNGFFSASAGASAAILGLLVVAVSIVNRDDDDETTRDRRTVLAGTAFVTLVDIFLVSIVALTGGPLVVALSSLVMALVGLLATSRLIPMARRAGNFSHGFPTRRRNLLFATASVGGYSLQLIVSAALLADAQSAFLLAVSVLVIVLLYCSALARVWEVTGITRRA